MVLKNLSDFPDDFILQNPYKEFEFSLADNERKTIFYNYTFFQCLELSASDGVRVLFGGAGGLGSDIIGAGVGYKLPAGKVTDRVEIVNESGGSLTGKIGLAIGDINDQRFVASGLVTIADKPSNFVTVADTALSTTAANVLAANTNRAEAFISNLDNVIDARWGDSNTSTTRGSVIAAGATAVIKGTDDIYVCSESGTPSIAISYSEYS